MYDGRRRSRSREGSYGARGSPRRHDDRDREYYYSRKDSSWSPPRSAHGYRDQDPTQGSSYHRPYREYRENRGDGRDYRNRGSGGDDHRVQGDDDPSLPYDDDVSESRPGPTTGHAPRWGRPSREPASGRMPHWDYPPTEPALDRVPRWERSQERAQYSRRDAAKMDQDAYGAHWDRSSRSPGERSGLSSNGERRRGRENTPSRSHSHSRPRNPVLVLDGFPLDATESDIAHGLDLVSGDSRFRAEKIDRVRLLDGRQGGRIALVEFFQLSDARAFMDRHHPTITLRLRARSNDPEPITMDLNLNWLTDDTLLDDYHHGGRRGERRVERGWTCSKCSRTNHRHHNSCYHCQSERAELPFSVPDNVYIPAGPILTGETDQCPQQVPSQYLVIRDLAASVTEDILAQGLMQLYLDEAPAAPKEAARTPTKAKLKSTAPTKSTAGLGARPNSLRRVFLIRDRRTDLSWKFGFAEFETLQDAQGAVAKFHAMDNFSIHSKPAIVAFIHTGVFVPAFDLADGSPFTFSPVYNPNVTLRYWDDRVYPSALVVSTEPILGAGSPGGTSSVKDAAGAEKSGAADVQGAMLPRESSGKKSKKDAAALSGKGALAMAPQMQMWAKKRAELHGISADERRLVEPSEKNKTTLSTAVAPIKVEQPKSPLAEPPKTLYGLPKPPSAPSGTPVSTKEERDPDGPRAPNWRDEIISYGYRTGDGRWRCALCPGSDKFSSAQALVDHEILDSKHTRNLNDSGMVADADAALKTRGTEPVKIPRREPRLRSEPPPVYTSFADRRHLVCLVCDPPRRFQNRHVLRLHETESMTHKRAMANQGNIDLAHKRLAKLRQRPRLMRPKTMNGADIADGFGATYRDRARERRIAFNQPSKPKAGSKRPRNEPAASNAEVAEAPVTKKPSKGAALLGKMGWSAGEGLGAQGDGPTDIVATDLYMPGVGLGADGGKVGDAAAEAARKTRGNFSEFVEKTKDKARERYEKMG